jgi:DNA polymerase V
MFTEPATLAHPVGPAAVDPIRRHLPLGATRVRLGFPSPSEDFLDDELDLNEWLVRNEAATFYYRAEGWSMLLAGICDGDLLIVDRSVAPIDGDLVLAIWDGNQPTCKVLKVFEHHLELHSANPDHPPIVLGPDIQVEVFAVTGIARQIVRGKRSRVRAR